ncbi:MAG TPA: DUF3667 domain-containing protein [Pseudomonadales bacterium]|nr:DUF3667 domain-containing protein [Pseudomonadales bacterium]
MSETAATCPNCGAPRLGRFCSACGQNDRSYLRATRELVGEVLSEAFDLDSRLARTLRCLILRPGFLSREFASDRRATYVSPVRLYFVVSVVFFTVLSLATRFESVKVDANAPAQVEFDLDHDADLARMYGDLTDAQRARLKTILEKHGVATDAVKRRIAELDAANAARPAPTVSEFEQLLSDRVLDIAEDPRGAYQNVISDLPAAMFLTLPLYALWLKLMYRRRFYAEHLVFALHLHTFLFLIGTFVVVLPDAPSQSTSVVVRAVVGVGEFADGTLKLIGLGYYLLALKAFYGESWGRTVAKFAAINAAHMTLIGVGVALVATVALVFY